MVLIDSSRFNIKMVSKGKLYVQLNSRHNVVLTPGLSPHFIIGFMLPFSFFFLL